MIELQLEPLMIDKESLIKCGFVMDNTYVNPDFRHLYIDLPSYGWKYRITYENEELSISANEEYNYHLKHIIYIYQLQQLYLLLTGDELKYTA